MITVITYIAFVLLLSGLLIRALKWRRFTGGAEKQNRSFPRNHVEKTKNSLRSFRDRHLPNMIRTLFLDVIFQVRILRYNWLRWLAHMCIFYGFIMLVFMHAIGNWVITPIFPDYASTLNPFLFLRNLGGVLVLAGLAVFAHRRYIKKNKTIINNRKDLIAILLLAAIIISGFTLEGVKIISAPVFEQMVEDYFPWGEPEEIESLGLYWSEKFGVVFADQPASTGPDTSVQGKELHEEYCAYCHSRPPAAFISYPLAKTLYPIARFLNSVRADTWLYYLHVILCLLGLALLPFSKFYHLVSTPMNLLTRPQVNTTGNISSEKFGPSIIELDACMHCGVCSEHCSVAPIFRICQNNSILPSEKLIAFKSLFRHSVKSSTAMELLAAGNYYCTLCYRCTQLCPAGINLQELWSTVQQVLEQKGVAGPRDWAGDIIASGPAALIDYYKSPQHPPPDTAGLSGLLIDRSQTYSACVQCTICTNVCPVVEMNPDSGNLELTPQQIMNLLRLDLIEAAFRSKFVWDCVTCYQCQENCPEGIKVADVIYELKNVAYARLNQERAEDVSASDDVRKG